MSATPGTRALLHIAVRRDRVRLTVWILVLGLMPTIFVSSFRQLYPSAVERATFAATSASNVAFTALYGPLTGSSLGQIAAWRAGFMPIVMALVAGFLVIRHTRQDEESGRLELLGSTAIGKAAPLASGLLVGVLLSTVSGLVVVLTTLANQQPISGSVLLGLSQTVAGVTFAAVGALAAQLTTTARNSRTILVATVVAASVPRMIADASSTGDGSLVWLRRITPLGWIGNVDPFGANRLSNVLVPLAVSVVLSLGALAWSRSRDLGAGLLADRAGPAQAHQHLRSVWALTWRLQRWSLLAWVMAGVVLALVTVGVAGGVDQLVRDNPSLGDAFARMAGGGASMTDAYMASMAVFFGLVATAQGVQAAMRIAEEEAASRAEVLLAQPVSRSAWVISHATVALVGPVASLAVGGLVLGVLRSLTGGSGSDVTKLLKATMIQLPATWVVVAVTLLIVAWRPRRSAWGWAVLGFCVLVVMVAAATSVGQWLDQLSPFTHLPHLPAESFRITPVLVMILVSGVILATALRKFQRRDIGA